jgi:hypothetical protein
MSILRTVFFALLMGVGLYLTGDGIQKVYRNKPNTFCQEAWYETQETVNGCVVVKTAQVHENNACYEITYIDKTTSCVGIPRGKNAAIGISFPCTIEDQIPVASIINMDETFQQIYLGVILILLGVVPVFIRDKPKGN